LLIEVLIACQLPVQFTAASAVFVLFSHRFQISKSINDAEALSDAKICGVW